MFLVRNEISFYSTVRYFYRVVFIDGIEDTLTTPSMISI